MKKIFWIIFFGAFYFLFTIQPVSSQCGWESVTTRYLSDIYIAGSLVSARSDETIYSWDIKLAYPKLFNKDIGGGRIWLSLSPLIEFIANKGTDANPDRGKIAGQINFMLDPTNGRTTVTEIHWLTDIGGEFDRKFDTRNFDYFLELLVITDTHLCLKLNWEQNSEKIFEIKSQTGDRAVLLEFTLDLMYTRN